MVEKARQGIWPSFAPIGYRNTVGPDGKRIIEPDPVDGPIIAMLFDRFATATVSIKRLAREVGSVRGRRLHQSLLHQILRKRIYTGDFDFDGVMYKGTHRPLVTRQTWDRVQRLLDGRAENKTRKVKHLFTSPALFIHCGHCGCLMVGELKKGRYVYYHCTGNRGRCGDPYVREERLTAEIAQALDGLVIAPETLELLERTVVDLDRTEQGAREQAGKRLKADYDRLQARIDVMYVDRLDGRITAEFFDAPATWDSLQRLRMRSILSAAVQSGGRHLLEGYP